jgi:hypothetical protein
VHFLGQAYSAGNPLGRLASEVLGLNNAGVTPALLQELPGDSSHQTRGGQDCDVGLLAKRRPLRRSSYYQPFMSPYYCNLVRREIGKEQK